MPTAPLTPIAETPTVVIRDSFDPIPCDYLDKENKGWAQKYLDTTRGRLDAARAAAEPDPAWIKYLERELASYQELLDRFAS